MLPPKVCNIAQDVLTRHAKGHEPKQESVQSSNAPIASTSYAVPPLLPDYGISTDLSAIDPQFHETAIDSPLTLHHPDYRETLPNLAPSFWSDLDTSWIYESIAQLVSMRKHVDQHDQSISAWAAVARQWPRFAGQTTPILADSSPCWQATSLVLSAGVEISQQLPPQAALIDKAITTFFAEYAGEHPFVHQPTLAPQNRTPLYILAICALGARGSGGESNLAFTQQVICRLVVYLQVRRSLMRNS